MHSVRLEPMKLILLIVGTRTTYQAIEDAGRQLPMTVGVCGREPFEDKNCVSYARSDIEGLVTKRRQTINRPKHTPVSEIPTNHCGGPQ